MAMFPFVPVTTGSAIPIIVADCRKGDVNPYDIPENGKYLGAFTTKGSIALYDAGMSLCDTFDPYKQISYSKDTGQPIAMVATDDTRFFCLGVPANIEVKKVLPNTEVSLSNVKGKRIFMAEGSAKINGKDIAEHCVCFCKTDDSKNVKIQTTPDKLAVIAVIETL